MPDTYVPSLFEKSPPWIIKPFMILWNGDPLRCRGNPVAFPMPASPVQSCRKFSAVWHVAHLQQGGWGNMRMWASKCGKNCINEQSHTFGAMSSYSSNTTLPRLTGPVGPPLMATSKYARGFASLRRAFLTLGMIRIEGAQMTEDWPTGTSVFLSADAARTSKPFRILQTVSYSANKHSGVLALIPQLPNIGPAKNFFTNDAYRHV